MIKSVRCIGGEIEDGELMVRYLQSKGLGDLLNGAIMGLPVGAIDPGQSIVCVGQLQGTSVSFQPRRLLVASFDLYNPLNEIRDGILVEDFKIGKNSQFHTVENIDAWSAERLAPDRVAPHLKFDLLHPMTIASIFYRSTHADKRVLVRAALIGTIREN